MKQPTKAHRLPSIAIGNSEGRTARRDDSGEIGLLADIDLSRRCVSQSELHTQGGEQQHQQRTDPMQPPA